MSKVTLQTKRYLDMLNLSIEEKGMILENILIYAINWETKHIWKITSVFDSIKKEIDKERGEKKITEITYTEDFENFWKKYPHVRGSDKKLAFSRYQKFNPKDVDNELTPYTWKCRFWIQNIQYIPACENRLSKLTITSYESKLTYIKQFAYKLMEVKPQDRAELAHKLHEDFWRDIIEWYVREYNNEKNGIKLNLK